MKIRYQQLSASERDASHRGRWLGQSPAAIADNLGCSRSTVSRELARNGGVASYAAPAAQRRYQPGRRRGRGAGGLHAQASGRPGLRQEDLRPAQGDGPAP
ncbi:MULTISPECIES: helix-turn-helix domain-containing protein [Methylococcus]|uniref:helix-turn-helix domain-containing protein n=1 Tax=Methylococcus TaxID=413 RepID=UPI0018DFB1B8|nr:hypothetical protein [Methylococcus capsulatus]